MKCLPFLKVAVVIALAARSGAIAEERVWKDSTGKFSVSAELVEVSGDHVRLRKVDGTELSVAIERLGAADRDYIKEQTTTTAPAKPEKASPLASEGGGLRTWTDESGEFSVEAELVDSSATEVRLRKTDGSVVTVPLDRLSTEDRKYVRGQKEAPDVPSALTGVRRALRIPVSVDFVATPLRDVATQLQERNGVNIFLDLRALQQVGRATDTPITHQASGQALESVLHEMLAAVELDFYIQWNEILVITTPEVAENHTECHVYRLRAPGPLPDFDTPISQVEQDVDRDGWDRVGGPGTIQPLPAPVPVLVVSTTYWNHHQIEQQFADRLRRVYGQAAAASVNRGLPEQLTKPAAFAISEMKLEEFARYITNTFGLAVEIDGEALNAAGIQLDMPVTADFSDVRLLTALDLTLNQVGCTWDIGKSGTFHVTTHSRTEKTTTPRDYPVGPFVSRPRSQQPDFASLIKVLRSCVLPSSWEAVGGPASIQPKGSNMITVNQSLIGHFAVADLLTELRAANAP